MQSIYGRVNNAKVEGPLSKPLIGWIALLISLIECSCIICITIVLVHLSQFHVERDNKDELASFEVV